MKHWWVVALGVVIGLLSAGVLWLASLPPRGNPITLLPPPTPVPIQVHVDGAVEAPGVYALPPESRVQDALAVAGGLTDEAEAAGLNLAAKLEDGQQVTVPTQIRVEVSTPQTPEQPQAGDPPTEAPSTSGPNFSLININTATQGELETLSGIGPVTAQKIIAFREENGPFTSIEEIQKVSGIGPVTFEKISGFITVEEVP